jgi:hypothetical protein
MRDEFLIIPDSMGSNCEVDNKTVSAMMAGTWKVKKVEAPDYSEIEEIRIFRGREAFKGAKIGS